MRVVTSDEMREMDRRAIHEFGIPGVVLMENAGAAVVEAVVAELGSARGKRIAIFCGTGNNGGDGYVAARRLAIIGALPTVYMLSSEAQLKGDALVHFSALKSSACADIRAFSDASFETGMGRFDLVIDALLGTGLRSAPREAYAEAIRVINVLGESLPVIAVDVPSGVDSDTGAVPGEAVRAKSTITFAYPKVGLYLFPGAQHVGRLHITDIGFKWDQIELNEDTRCSLIDPADFGNLFDARPSESNKGDYGHVGIIAGSRGMAGAPSLAARAAQRAGAGLVTVLTAESAQPAVAAKLDEQMTIPLPEEDGAVCAAAFDRIAEFAERATVLCIGPGLTTGPGAVELVLRILKEIKKPIVLDADGLNALARHADELETLGGNLPLIITPHPGEAARLLGTDIAAIQSNRIGSVRRLAAAIGAVAILKGRYSLVSDAAGRIGINTTGNPGMASGGMGDTLTGIVGGLLAQCIARERTGGANGKAGEIIVPAVRASTAGVYLHGLAGDLAAAQGEMGLIAGDVIERLPSAMRAIAESRG